MNSKAMLQRAGWAAFPEPSIHNVPRPRLARIRVFVVGLLGVFIVASPAAALAQAQTPQTLLHEYKCYLCHADSEAKAGPAYVDVAAKYRGRPEAVAKIAEIVKRGSHGGGPWHMPPHPEVSDAEATVMARYILSLKP